MILKVVFVVIIKCKECGGDMSTLAKFCPKCGCPNKTRRKSKLSVASFVLGIIDIFYSLGLCLNVYFGEFKNPEFVFIIIILTILSFVFGVVSLQENGKQKKAIFGTILSVISMIVTIIALVI